MERARAAVETVRMRIADKSTRGESPSPADVAEADTAVKGLKRAQAVESDAVAVVDAAWTARDGAKADRDRAAEAAKEADEAALEAPTIRKQADHYVEQSRLAAAARCQQERAAQEDPEQCATIEDGMRTRL